MRFAQEISIFNPNAIELAVTGLGTRITQTAQEIRLEAAKTLANYSTTVQMNSAISTKADEITLQVSETYATQAGVNSQVSSLSSRITQNANSITAEVTNRQNADTSLSSRITQNANSITAEVTNRQNADTSLSSRITQNASAIELRVQKDELISTINQTAGSVKISASKIDLSGYVTISSLKQGGTTVVDGSRITTGFISADRIATDSIDVDKLKGKISNNDWEINFKDGTFSIGSISANDITAGTLTGVTLRATGGIYGDIEIGNSIVRVPWIDFVSYGTKYCGIAIDGNVEHENTGFHRLITGHGIHIAHESECTSWFENYCRFDYGLYNGSDRRMKKEILPIDEDRARHLILGLKPSTFRYEVTPKIKHHGFIAQEVRALLDDDNEIVTGDESKEMLGLFYEDLIADVVAVIQSQERRITALEGRTDG